MTLTNPLLTALELISALTSLAVDVTVVEAVPSVIVSVTEFEVDVLLTDRFWLAAAVANLIVTGLVWTP